METLAMLTMPPPINNLLSKDFWVDLNQALSAGIPKKKKKGRLGTQSKFLTVLGSYYTLLRAFSWLGSPGDP